MNKARILVVEDELIVARDIQRRLAQLGYEPVAATGYAAEAVALAGQLRPDLVLMDIHLADHRQPELLAAGERQPAQMDGIVAAAKIRELLDIPVVYLTAYADDTTLAQAKLTGPFGYVVKPFEDRELRSTLEMALYKHASEKRVNHLNQVLRAMRAVNHLITRQTNPDHLIARACEILAQTRGYRLVWIGLRNGDRLRLQASSGEGLPFVETIIATATAAQGQALPGTTAARTGQPVICHDVQHDDRYAPWENLAREFGLHSTAAIPLRSHGDNFGVLNVYADRTGIFGAEEVNLLLELAGDLAFGLKFLHEEQARREAEHALQQNEAELAAVYDHAPFMMCLLTRAWEVKRMNRAMEQLIGPQAAADRLKFGRVLGCANAADTPTGCGGGDFCRTCLLRLALLETFERGEATKCLEATLPLFHAGENRELRVSISTALVQTGDEVKLLLCLEDITARKQLESQFLQAQKMEAVGQLAGGVAHDFNNILSATLMHLSLMQDTPGLDPDLATSLQELNHQTQRAANLTRQLLTFSRRRAIQRRRVDLNEIVEGINKMLGRLLGEHIHITWRPATEASWIEADPGMIEQVIMNLCVNARDAMPKGGRLALDTTHVEIQPGEAQQQVEARVGSFVRLTVNDTGSGMSEATLKHIFEPFFTTKEVGKGTGLGLATVYSIARQHEGWVTVQSGVGLGTTFQVFLPAAPADARTEESPDEVSRLPKGQETILLVEDDMNLLKPTGQILRRCGYRVLEARNGVEALHVWEETGRQAQLLLTDMVMPGGISGLELAETLRRAKPGLKIILTSGYSDELVQRSDPVAHARFLAKPYSSLELAQAIKDCLDGKD